MNVSRNGDCDDGVAHSIGGAYFDHGVDDVALEEGNFHLVAGSTGVNVVKHADDYCRKSH